MAGGKYFSPCLLFFGALTFGASVFVGYYVVPYKVWENIIQQSKIIQGNTRFKTWERAPVPILQHIYFFNVTNPDGVIDGAKPILKEIGPYIYQLKREKFDVVFNKDNGTIFYREKTDYFFRPELSNGSESDLITFVNIPYVSAVQTAVKADFVTRYVIEEVLRKFPKAQLYLHLTIKELMFGGYYLPFLKELSDLNGKEILPNNKFGLYYKRNSTNQGRFEVYSGVKYPEKFGEVASWNGKTSLDWWGNEYCNRINGSDGGVFTPYADKERILYMFIPGFCRSFRFDYEMDGLEVKGVPVSKYSVTPRFFASAKTNPDNACYCNESPENSNLCHEDGVLPLENCGKGAMVLSQPHFYQGSDLYLNQSVGLRPDKEKHEMALYIETYTSAPARVKMRFQMNVNLEPTKRLKPLKKIQKMIHPLFWIDQKVELPDDSALTLRNKLYGTLHIANILTHVGIVVGAALIILSLVTFFMCTLKPPKKEDAEAVECVSVSYHPKEILHKVPNGNVKTSQCNGKVDNGFTNSNRVPNNSKDTIQTGDDGEEAVPFLRINGIDLKGPSEKLLNLADHTDGEGERQREKCLHCCTDDDGYVINKSKVKNSHLHSKDSQAISAQQFPSDDNRPDFLLNPFPVVTDYSRSKSISNKNVNSTVKDLVDATSSYENL